eukprot:TRINITY_DN2078_c0_g1_i4.p1 TRINITY_DN2078_c0_g1~~TRINITY_DN2078_c0_g1_i4.p1  ORF type:complete len:312 (-),score=47.00 TRINITY_DN2078_c0_g1_i4:87-1022(-)
MAVPIRFFLLAFLLVASAAISRAGESSQELEVIHSQQEKIGDSLLKAISNIIDKGNTSEISNLFAPDATAHLPIAPKTAVGIEQISVEFMNLRYLVVSLEYLTVSYIYVSSSRFFMQVRHKISVITPIGTFKNFTRDYIADIQLTTPAASNPFPKIKSYTEYSDYTHIFVARGLCAIPDKHYDSKFLLCPSPFPPNTTEQTEAAHKEQPVTLSSLPSTHTATHTNNQPATVNNNHPEVQPPHSVNTPSTPNPTPHIKPNTPAPIHHVPSSSIQESTENIEQGNPSQSGKKKRKGFRRRQRFGGPRSNYVTW